MKRLIILLGVALLFGATMPGAGLAEDEPPYDGRKKCSSCHKSQYKSWRETSHGNAFASLEPGEKVDEKILADLDPDKDYTEDEKCVGCHTTGFGREYGYEIDYPSKYLVNVTCESCHGPGSEYRRIHRNAAVDFDKGLGSTPRQDLVDAGEEFAFVERCNACHMNYEGSPWPGAEPPYTPFTPALGAEYEFDFEKAVRDDKAMHEHFKLDGIFTGPPTPPFHEEFQATATPIVIE